MEGYRTETAEKMYDRHGVSIYTCYRFAAGHRRVITVGIEGAFLLSVMTNEVYMEISGQCKEVQLYN